MSYLNYGDRELFKKARSLRKSMTKAEILLWSKIRSRQIENLKFRRQAPVYHYIADFYCDSLKMIIEVDGEIHNEDSKRVYDIERDKVLKDHGFKIMRFNNNEVEFELNSVVRKIESFLYQNYPELYSERSNINDK